MILIGRSSVTLSWVMSNRGSSVNARSPYDSYEMRGPAIRREAGPLLAERKDRQEVFHG